MAFPHRKMKARREALGLSREQVAEISGASVRSIEGIEQGRTGNPNYDTLMGLCAALKVPCEFFFSDDIPEADDPPARGRPKK